jgi:hypothetical protein
MSGKGAYSGGDESILDDDQSFVTEDERWHPTGQSYSLFGNILDDDQSFFAAKDERRHFTGQSNTLFGDLLDTVAQGLGFDVASTSSYGDSVNEESTMDTTSDDDESAREEEIARRGRGEKKVRSLAIVDEESTLVGQDEFSVDFMNYRALHANPEASQDSKWTLDESSISLNVVDLQRIRLTRGGRGELYPYTSPERKTNNGKNQNIKASAAGSPKTDIHKRTNDNVKPRSSVAISRGAVVPEHKIPKRLNVAMDTHAAAASPLTVVVKNKDVKSNSRTVNAKVPVDGFLEGFLYNLRNEDPKPKNETTDSKKVKVNSPTAAVSRSLSPAKNAKSNLTTGKVKAHAAATPKSMKGKVKTPTAAVPRSPVPAKHAKTSSKTEKVEAPAAETPRPSTLASSRANTEDWTPLEGTMGPPSFSRQAEASKKTTAHVLQYIPAVDELERKSRLGNWSPPKVVDAIKSTDNNSDSSPTGLQEFPFLPSPEPKNFTESFMDLITCRSPNAPLGTKEAEDEALKNSFIRIVPGDESSIGDFTATTYMLNLDLVEQEVVGKLAMTRGDGGKKTSSIYKGGPGSNNSACHDTVRIENYFEEYVQEPSPTTEAADIAQAKQTATTMVDGGIRGLKLFGSR